jgi:two-component system, NarL family, sensor kinase
VTGGRADVADVARDDVGPVHGLDPTSVGRTQPAPLPLGFMVAAGAASIVVALGAIVLELSPPARIDGLLPELVAGAALCVGLLARRWAPALAWVALIVASLVAASIPIAVSRAADPVATGLGTWLVVAARSSAAAILTVLVAALYATRSERRATGRVTTLATFLVAWLVMACLLVVVLVIAGARYDPAFSWVDLATWPTSVFIQFVLVLTAFGVAADLRAASLRADARLAADPGSRADDDAERFGDRLRATLRELVPGQAEAQAAAVESERVRLAGDLHAVVLPALRRAIAEIEAGAPVEALAGRLRTVDLELERLMADRWPVVLEAFGLVEALEDLAERTEADGAVRVGLEVEGAAGRPRPEIERTAWRVAQVAVDNAVRHAAATQITIVIAVAPDLVRLSVADDGRGLDPTDPIRTSARGLNDIARRAAAVGGRVVIESASPAGSGTVVRFDWPARG